MGKLTISFYFPSAHHHQAGLPCYELVIELASFNGTFFNQEISPIEIKTRPAQLVTGSTHQGYFWNISASNEGLRGLSAFLSQHFFGISCLAMDGHVTTDFLVNIN